MYSLKMERTASASAALLRREFISSTTLPGSTSVLECPQSFAILLAIDSIFAECRSSVTSWIWFCLPTSPSALQAHHHSQDLCDPLLDLLDSGSSSSLPPAASDVSACSSISPALLKTRIDECRIASTNGLSMPRGLYCSCSKLIDSGLTRADQDSSGSQPCLARLP